MTDRRPCSRNGRLHPSEHRASALSETKIEALERLCDIWDELACAASLAESVSAQERARVLIEDMAVVWDDVEAALFSAADAAACLFVEVEALAKEDRR